ncbi:MAG: FadR/GntR family transcriptional regulator [Halocynthiibacter sp.]
MVTSKNTAVKNVRFQTIPRVTLSDAIAQQIIDLITQNELRSGDRLPSERALCDQLGVGRTSVREALKSLSATGVLSRHGSAGTFVASESQILENKMNWGVQLTGQEVENVIETRAMLEKHTAYWAANRASDQNIDTLRKLQMDMHNALGDPDKFHDLDVDFHLEIARATQNDILFRMVQTMRTHLSVWIRQRLSVRHGKMLELSGASFSEHQLVLDRIAAHDPEGASSEMARHIETASKDLRARLRLKTK